jgi:hypothetical protein
MQIVVEGDKLGLIKTARPTPVSRPLHTSRIGNFVRLKLICNGSLLALYSSLLLTSLTLGNTHGHW